MGGGGGGISSSDLKKLEEKAKEILKPKTDSCHVFISFASEDEDEVNLLRGQAKNKNTELEFDDFSLREAVKSNNKDYIKQKIRERIDRASVTVVYLSSDSCNSNWVDWEITESLKRGKDVIGVYKGDSPPSQLPDAFKKSNLKSVKWSHHALMAAIVEARKNR